MKTLDAIEKEVLEGQKKYYIYVLYKPDKTPFYVGKGSSNRISAHEAETRYYLNGRTWTGVNLLKLNTIKKIWLEGKQVLYLIDSWHDDLNYAADREIELVKFYGRKILNEGPLTNIRDGGNLMSDESRKILSEKLKLFWKTHPEAKEEMSKTISSFCSNNPEFIVNLQECKNKWIEEKPNEYLEAERKRLEICSSDEHRNLMSEIMTEYFESNLEELERLKTQGANYWIDNDEVKEQARLRTIENKSHENLIKWAEENPDLVDIRTKASQINLMNWSKEKLDEYNAMLVNRNNKLRSDDHRKNMSNKTKQFIKDNPEEYKANREKANKSLRDKRRLKFECLELLAKNIVKRGEICLPKHGKVTDSVYYSWKKKGLLPENFPTYSATVNEWIKYKETLL